MAQDSFQQVCDQLSHAIDDVQFERFRWARDEAPKLARLVELVRAAFEGREDYDLTEEGATSAEKGFVLKVHGNRIVAIAVSLQDGMAVIRPSTIARSPYILTDTQPVTADYDVVDEQWISDSLQMLLGRIRSGTDSEAPAQDAPEAAMHTGETRPSPPATG